MRQLVRIWEEQEWLDGAGRVIERSLERALERLPGRKLVVDTLHGVWLGHPLHPSLTDVPLGSWTAAATIDLIPARSGRPHGASTAAVAVGVAGAVAAAAAGLMDWRHLEGKTRRVGTAHALLNSLALDFYLASLACRLLGRGPARKLSFLGLGVATLSAYLGGHLVLDKGVGVKRSPMVEPREDFTPIMPESDLPEGRLQRVDASGYPLLLLRRADTIFAVADTCTHMGCSLSGGPFDGDSVTCPCHDSRFSLADGAVLSGPAVYPLQAFDARIRDGQVEVRARTDAAPSADRVQQALRRLVRSDASPP